MRAIKTFGLMAAAALAAPAFAQVDPPAPPIDAGGGPMADRVAHHQEMAAHRAAHEARREDDLALILDLTAPQRERLHAFLTAMHPPHDDRRPGRPGFRRPGLDRHDGDPASMTFGARLADMQAHLDQRTHEEQGRLAAARAFYGSLDARQQQKFEAIQRLDAHDGPPPPRPMMRGGAGGPGGPGPDMPPPHGELPPPPPPAQE